MGTLQKTSGLKMEVDGNVLLTAGRPTSVADIPRSGCLEIATVGGNGLHEV